MDECAFTNEVAVGSNPVAVTYTYIYYYNLF